MQAPGGKKNGSDGDTGGQERDIQFLVGREP